MHRIPIGPMGADRIIPIDTQPIIMDIIVPTTGGSSFKTYKDSNLFSVISFWPRVFFTLRPFIGPTNGLIKDVLDIYQ